MDFTPEQLYLYFPLGLLLLLIVLLQLARLVAGTTVKARSALWIAIIGWPASIAAICGGREFLYSVLDIGEAGPGAILWELAGLVLYGILFGIGVAVAFSVTAKRARWRILLAGFLVAVCLPLAIIFALDRIHAVSEARSLAESRRRYSPVESRQDIDPADWGIAVPANWKPEKLWSSTYHEEFVGINRSNWDSYCDFGGAIYHRQYCGYSIPSELFDLPWDGIIEDAARELAAGLQANGYSLYIGRGYTEHRPFDGQWKTYTEPIIAGLRDDAFVRIRLVPDAREKASGPWMSVQVYTQNPRRIFGWSTADDQLVELEYPRDEPLFTVLDGYVGQTAQGGS